MFRYVVIFLFFSLLNTTVLSSKIMCEGFVGHSNVFLPETAKEARLKDLAILLTEYQATNSSDILKGLQSYGDLSRNFNCLFIIYKKDSSFLNVPLFKEAQKELKALERPVSSIIRDGETIYFNKFNMEIDGPDSCTFCADIINNEQTEFMYIMGFRE